MRYWIDTEFIEYPCTIDLISVGVVSEDDRELYLVSSEFDASMANAWVEDNVLSNLGLGRRLPNSEIAGHLLRFIGHDSPRIWGYYADYDWVAICWLFGPMIELPDGWPMYCRDIKQLADGLGNPKLPADPDAEHNALADARWNRRAHEFLMNLG